MCIEVSQKAKASAVECLPELAQRWTLHTPMLPDKCRPAGYQPTKSLAIALEKYGDYGIVRIDLERVTSRVVDVSGGFRKFYGRITNWAESSEEVLIEEFAPSDAITRIYP